MSDQPRISDPGSLAAAIRQLEQDFMMAFERLSHAGREDQNTMIEAVEHQGVNLSTWEEMFIESLRSQFDAGRELSEKQLEVLERIYARRTP